jgi:hypothetical protein
MQNIHDVFADGLISETILLLFGFAGHNFTIT